MSGFNKEQDKIQKGLVQYGDKILKAAREDAGKRHVMVVVMEEDSNDNAVFGISTNVRDEDMRKGMIVQLAILMGIIDKSDLDDPNLN